MNTSSEQSTASEPIRLASQLGLAIPSILLPQPGIDLYRWPVIACDQFTAQPEYWAETLEIVGDAPSTLHMILPEMYLEHPDEMPVSERISRINTRMAQYLDDGTLRKLSPGWIVLDRATPEHPSRKGLVLAVDLEHYDFKPGNHELIRATEGTVLERIPPRLAIRRDAPLELPHVQLLIDDPDRTVIEPLIEQLKIAGPLYQTTLMQAGGSVAAWFVDAGSPEMLQALNALAGLKSYHEYGMLFAVGDGNHSLATAKAHWENLRDQAGPDHPARYALVEVVNIHDVGLDFEAIHRVVYDLSVEQFMDEAAVFYQDQDLQITEEKSGNPADASSSADFQLIPLLSNGSRWSLRINKPRHSLAAGSIQAFLDALVARQNIRIDYIHGADVVEQLSAQGQIGLLLPALEKGDFFNSIAVDGILPRKTFSMGEAREKRYYFECRQIR